MPIITPPIVSRRRDCRTSAGFPATHGGRIGPLADGRRPGGANAEQTAPGRPSHDPWINASTSRPRPERRSSVRPVARVTDRLYVNPDVRQFRRTSVPTWLRTVLPYSRATLPVAGRSDRIGPAGRSPVRSRGHAGRSGPIGPGAHPVGPGVVRKFVRAGASRFRGGFARQSHRRFHDRIRQPVSVAPDDFKDRSGEPSGDDRLAWPRARRRRPAWSQSPCGRRSCDRPGHP
jgi:hypothetical protein